MNRAPVAPVRLNPDLPAELERIINKALEKDRDLRYRSAADLETDLKRLKRDTESGQGAIDESRHQCQPRAPRQLDRSPGRNGPPSRRLSLSPSPCSWSGCALRFRRPEILGSKQITSDGLPKITSRGRRQPSLLH